MQKSLYQVQQSTVKYRFSFRTLSDRNMKMGCHAIFFLQRLNLVPRGFIILDRTHSFHGIFGQFARESAETFSLRKILSPRKKPVFYAMNAWKPLSILERIWWLNHHFIIKKNKRLDTRLRKPNYESSLVANII